MEIELIENEFRRVLINILENAYDSLQDKKNLQADFEPSINISIEEEASSVKIIIRDNGQGIAQEELEISFYHFIHKSDQLREQD